MDTQILEDLGLKPSEIKVYLSLLELGSAHAHQILEETNIQNSVMHRALNSLIKKSLINFVYEGRRRVYQATDPEAFYTYLNDKRDRFTEILPELKKKQSFQRTSHNASIYHGVRGIKEVYKIMRDTEPGEYLTFGGGYPTIEVMGNTWWLNHHVKRVRNGLPSRQVFDETVRTEAGAEISDMDITNVRFIAGEFAQFQETVIAGDKVAISIFTQTPYSVLIRDPAVAAGYKKHFEILWAQAGTS